MKSRKNGWVRLGLAVAVASVSLAADCGPSRIDPACLVTWSPDGTKAALVPSALTLKDRESGVWVYAAETGALRRVFDPGPKRACLQPQWSPFSEEILFTLVSMEESDDGNDSYSVWVVRPDGRELRQVVDGVTPKATALLLPHSVMWGAVPGTVIFQIARGDEVTAEVFDPYTGRRGSFLPGFAEAYAIEPSPCRRLVAAILFTDDGRTGSVFVSEFGFGNWRALGSIRTDPEWLEQGFPTLFWAPDSSCFVTPEVEDGLVSAEHCLRRFDVRTGLSECVSRGRINGPVLWDPWARYFLFAGQIASDEGAAGVFRVDLNLRRAVPLVRAGNALLLGWDRDNGEFVFSTEPVPGAIEVGSGAPDGSRLSRPAPAFQIQEGEACSLSPGGRRLAVVRKSGEFSVLGGRWQTTAAHGEH